MRQLSIILLVLLAALGAKAQQTMNVYQGGTAQSHALMEGDSLYMNADQSILYFTNNGNTLPFNVADIDSITFTNDWAYNVLIEYTGNAVNVTNPLSGNGVQVAVSGNDVVVESTSTVQDINYVLTGTTANGSFKMYSEKRYNVLLNNVSITNSVGPAINLQSTKKATIHLLSGTINHLYDGATYAAALVISGIAEDQKATLFGEGDMEFLGSGQLMIHAMGNQQHAISCDEEIEFTEGNILVMSSVRDGIHGSEGVYMHGGELEVTAQGDGVDAEVGVFEMSCGTLIVHSTTNDVKALRSDTLMTISGGELTVNISGGASKGLDCGGGLNISGGTLNLSSSGLAVLAAMGSGQDVAYSSLLTADGAMHISGGTIALTSNGKGGRGISANGNLLITGGDLEITASGNGATYTNSTGTADAYHSTGIKVNGQFEWLGGELSIVNSGTGGKGIDVDGQFVIGENNAGPVGFVTTTGANITIPSGGGGGPGGGNNGNYDESKTIKVDGNITVNGGEVTVESNDDGMKSGGAIVFNGGSFTVTNSEEGVEAPFITVNNGYIDITSADDGFNTSNGTGGESNDGSILTINDGYIDINSTGGDALDSNGNITVNGGTTVVHGPQSSPEVGMDFNGVGKVTGGFIVISGTNSNMTQGFGNTSTQRSLILKTTQSIAANTIIHLEDADGNNVFTFKPKRSYYSVVFSSPLLVQGTTYTLYTGGTSTGTVSEGLVTGGAYTPGTNESTVNPTNMVTTVNF
jgi:trimeric autotransporter adhesin